MPQPLHRICSYPGCLERTTERYCPAHKSLAAREYDQQRRSPDHNHLLIDPESAEVVRMIFTMASTTYGYNTIVKHLTRRKILTPQSYFAAHNPDYFKKKPFTLHCQWNNKSVQVILENPIYLGNLVYGKTRSKKIRSKDRSARPENE